MKRCLYIMFLSIFVDVNGYAQAGKNQRLNYDNVFADLPLNDAGVNSVLAPHEDATNKIRTNIFIKARSNKVRCYEGEPLLLTYELYSSLQSTSEIIGLPQLPGFIAYPMGTENENAEYRDFNGRQCRFFNMLQLQILPMQEGVLKIEPISVRNEVVYISPDGHKKQYEGLLQSEPIYLEVKALPTARKPINFSGAIGKFSIHASVKSAEMQQGQRNVLIIEVNGVGNFNSVKPPEIAWLEEFEFESVAERQEVDYTVFPATGRKVFEFSFRAKASGNLLMPAVIFSFFDPSGKQYEQVGSNPVEILVAPIKRNLDEGSKVSGKTPSYFNIKYFFYLLILLLPLLVIYIRRKTKGQTTRSAMWKEASIVETTGTEQSKIRLEITRLSEVKDPAEYISRLKGLMKDYLSTEFELQNRSEEGIVKQLLLHDRVFAEHVANLFADCNGLLYGRGNLTESVRHALESSLITVIELVDRIASQHCNNVQKSL